MSSTYATAVVRYAPVEHITTLSKREWRMSGWMDLPARRIDVGGEEEEPLVLQWAGSPAMLASALARSGWQPAKQINLSTFQGFLVGNTRPDDLPTIPKLNGGQVPNLTLVRVISHDERDVMRIWDSRFRIKNGEQQPLLVASIIRERLDHPLGWITLPRRDQRASVDTAALSTLPNATIVKRPASNSTSAGAAQSDTTVLAGS